MGKKKKRPHLGSCTCSQCETNGSGRPQVLGDVGGGNSRKKAGGAAGAAFGAAMAVGGAYGEPAQSSDTTERKWAESSLRAQELRQTGDMNDATRDKGKSSSDSSLDDD